jgi:hypothetical protein
MINKETTMSHNPLNKDCHLNRWTFPAEKNSAPTCTCPQVEIDRVEEIPISLRGLLPGDEEICKGCINLLSELDKANAENEKLTSEIDSSIPHYKYGELRSALDTAEAELNGTRLILAEKVETNKKLYAENARLREAIENAQCDIECANDWALVVTNNYFLPPEERTEPKCTCWKSEALR